jgi:hypothetical protein
MPTLFAALDRLAIELMTNADLVPLQRRFRRARTALQTALEFGLSLRTLTDELKKRGVLDQRGRPLSYGNLRVLIARINRKQMPEQAATPVPPAAAPHFRGKKSSAPKKAPVFTGLFTDAELKKK